MRRFKSLRQLQSFLSVHSPINNLFPLGQHLMKAVHYRPTRDQAFNGARRSVRLSLICPHTTPPRTPQDRVQHVPLARPFATQLTIFVTLRFEVRIDISSPGVVPEKRPSVCRFPQLPLQPGHTRGGDHEPYPNVTASPPRLVRPLPFLWSDH